MTHDRAFRVLVTEIWLIFILVFVDKSIDAADELLYVPDVASMAISGGKSRSG